MIHDNRTIILLKKIEKLGEKFNRLNLLFYELRRSLEIKAEQGKTYKELSQEVKELDIKKLQDLCNDFKLNDLKKNKNKPNREQVRKLIEGLRQIYNNHAFNTEEENTIQNALVFLGKLIKIKSQDSLSF